MRHRHLITGLATAARLLAGCGGQEAEQAAGEEVASGDAAAAAEPSALTVW